MMPCIETETADRVARRPRYQGGVNRVNHRPIMALSVGSRRSRNGRDAADRGGLGHSCCSDCASQCELALVCTFLLCVYSTLNHRKHRIMLTKTL